MKQSLFTSLLLLLALINLANVPRHSFIHISRKDGLASNDVYDICQDEKGFYWVATDNGLQRYDGKRWVTPVYADPETVPSKPVKQLIPVNASTLMLKIGDTYGLFNTVNFHFTPIAIPAEKHRGIESFLWTDSRKNIFLVLKGQAILWFDGAGNRFTEKLPIEIPVGFKPSCIFEDVQHNQYWIGGASGITVYDANEKQVFIRGDNPKKLPLLDDGKFRNVSAIYIDTSRRHWMVYGNDKQSFACFDERKNTYLEQFENIGSNYKGTFDINNLFQSVEGEMWFYGRSALFDYNSRTGEFYNNKSDLMSSSGARFSSVRTIMQDREKGIWIATNEGLYQFYTVLPEVQNIILKTDKDDNNITAAAQVDNGEIWLTSRGKGVFSFTPGVGRAKVDYLFSNVPAGKEYAVKHALNVHQHTRSRKIWIACVRGTLIVADHSVKSKMIITPAAFNGEAVTSIAEDLSGRLWFGTQAGSVVMHDGASSYSDESFRRITSVKSPVTKLVVDKPGTLWICTGNGLIAFDTDNKAIKAHYKQDTGKGESLSSNSVNDVVQLNDTMYAIATDLLDVLNIKTKRVTTLSFRDGLLSNTILGMQKDKQGFLWIATSNGVCRYNVARNKFTVYEEKDGFMNFETVGTSGTLLADGKILFAGRNYLVTFPPELLNRQQPPPAVAITDLKVLNSFTPLNELPEKFEFDHNENSVSFYFSAMSYLLKDKLTYYYKLSGIDDKWIKADNSLAAVYTLLPSGTYSFEVRCENEEGLLSPITSLALIIHPPFWKTWWFSALIVLGALGLLYLAHRLRVKRIVALAELRNRVARDLHDDVGSTLSTISILSTMAKGKLEENPLQAGSYISKISDNSQQMMDAMDDIVWSIKPMNDSMQKIIARMREFASGALEPKNIDIDFEVDERVPHLKLNMEARRDLFLIFKEGVNNVAKYSECTHVTIRISYHDKQLVLKLKDNGRGFDPDNADTGNGISNMKKRAALLNGRINWYSEKKSGTLVQLTIPVKK